MTDATASPVLAWTEQLEDTAALDSVAALVRPLVNALVADPGRRDLLRGAWLGHAVHPPLTDVTAGFLTSAVTLDLVGGKAARPAARRLILLALLTFGPTAWTGWAEWSTLEPRLQRVGVVHAVGNGAAAAGFLASWRARGRGEHARGVVLALGSSALLAAAGYLGGHLVARQSDEVRGPR